MHPQFRQVQQAQVARAALRETDRFLSQVVDGPDEDYRSIGQYFKERMGGSPCTFQVPFNAFRDLVTTSASAGGYLVGRPKLTLQDLMRGWSLVSGLGVTFIEGAQASGGDAVQVTAGMTGTWTNAEGVQITASQPTLAEVALQAKHAGVFGIQSRQFMLQVDNSGEFMGQQLLTCMDSLLSAGIISGTGVNGQPTGIVNAAGVNTVSGTTLGHTGLRTMRRKIIEAGGIEENIVCVGGPAAQDTLGGRELASTGGGRFCWDTDGVLGRPAHATINCTTDTLVMGDWSRCILAVFGDTLTVEFNPYENFQAGKVSARLLLEVDVGFGPTKAFSVSTSVT